MVITRVALDQAIILPLNMFVFCSWPALLTLGPTEEGLAETSPIMRRWWRDGYDAHTASQDRAMAA